MNATETLTFFRIIKNSNCDDLKQIINCALDEIILKQETEYYKILNKDNRLILEEKSFMT
jgi:hypothetical protein